MYIKTSTQHSTLPVQEHNPKLGKAKKHPAYCVYLAYRLIKYSDMSSGAASDDDGLVGDVTPSDDTTDDDDQEVLEELEETQLGRRLESLEQENKVLKEMLGKLDHSRSWLEERVDVLEQVMKNRKFSRDIKEDAEDKVSHNI